MSGIAPVSLSVLFIPLKILNRNLNELCDVLTEDNVLSRMIFDYGDGHAVNGLHNSMSYLASPFSFFGWHVEDGDLGAISYLHWGAEKTWYM